MSNRSQRLILFIGDLAALHLALFLTLLIRYGFSSWDSHWQSHWFNFLPVFLIWILIFYISNFYNNNARTSGRAFFRLTANSAAISTVLSIIYFYLNVQSSIAPKTNLAIFILIFIVLFYLWRFLNQMIGRKFLAKNRLALVGSDDKLAKLRSALSHNANNSYEIALICREASSLNTLASDIRNHNIRTVVVGDDFGQSAVLEAALFDCLAYKINFFNYPDFYELLTGKIPVEEIDSNWFLNNFREGEKNYFNFFKRLSDLILSLVILLISLPFWPLIALVIKLSSRGPVIFRQLRLGKDGREFSILKFRTMRIENNDLSPTTENDQRITSVGSFLRKTRIDEIPQLINIIKGDMSFIGPRPERPEIVTQLEKNIPFYRTRLLIKPGLTGWDQISGIYHSASYSDSREKLQYDLFYLKNRSFYLDLDITLRTLAIMVSRAGR